MIIPDPFANLPAEVKQEHFKQLNAHKEELRKNPKLKSLFIEMTLNCNEHCLHCGSRAGEQHAVAGIGQPGIQTSCPAVSRSTKPLTDDEILTALKRLRRDLIKDREPLPFLNITGGEPLLRPHLPELMAEIHKLGYNWGMTTNGLLMTEEMARKFKKAGMYSVSISLDGMKENHEWFRQTKGSWQRALDAVDHLIDAGIESVMITTVLNQRNKGELNELHEVVKAHHCKNWRIIGIDPIGRALDNTELQLKSEDYKNMIGYIIDHQDDPDMSVLYTCNYYVGLERERKVRPWYYFCRAGLALASIQYNGDISACLDIERRPELVFGNVRDDDLLKVWKTGFGIYREHKEEKSTKCRTCRHKENCQGSGWHTWNFDTNEPRICMMEELGELL